MTDWRDAVLAGVVALGDSGGNGSPPLRHPGGAGAPPPRGETALWTGHGCIGRADIVVAAWDFTVRGGSFGEQDATAFVQACAEAATTRRALVTMLRSGGTRLQEGMRALVGIPRAVLALGELAAAGVPHICVADQPTTGGVWVAIGATADLRVGVAGATVGFSGPRVIEAMTGVAVPRGTNTAESAYAAGLLDAVVAPEQLATWLEQTLVALRPDDPQPTSPPVPVGVPDRGGWAQVEHSRTTQRPSGAELLDAMLGESVPLRGGDETVAAVAGRIAGHRVLGVALAARRASRPTPAGYELLCRAARLSDRLDVALVVLVDCPGADPLPLSEQHGIAPAIAAAMQTMLACRAPTVAVVHGEGGSGGALAGAVADVIGVTENGWFAALGPEGAAATLSITPADAADLMGVTPRDLLASGFADALAPAEAAPLGEWVAARLDIARGRPTAERLSARRARWSAELPGSPLSAKPDSPDIA